MTPSKQLKEKQTPGNNFRWKLQTLNIAWKLFTASHCISKNFSGHFRWILCGLNASVVAACDRQVYPFPNYEHSPYIESSRFRTKEHEFIAAITSLVKQPLSGSELKNNASHRAVRKLERQWCSEIRGKMAVIQK